MEISPNAKWPVSMSEEQSTERRTGWQFKKPPMAPQLKEASPETGASLSEQNHSSTELPAKTQSAQTEPIDAPGRLEKAPGKFQTPTPAADYLSIAPPPSRLLDQSRFTQPSSMRGRLSIFAGLVFVGLYFLLHVHSFSGGHKNPVFLLLAMLIAYALKVFFRRLLGGGVAPSPAERKRTALLRRSTLIVMFLIFGLISLLFCPLLFTFTKGEMLYKNGKYGDAIGAFRSASIVPGMAPEVINFNVGRCYFQLSQYEKAEAEYLKALGSDPDNPYYHIGLADTYYEMGRYQKAVDEYTKAIAHKTKDGELHAFRADAYDYLGKSSLAKADRLMATKLGYKGK